MVSLDRQHFLVTPYLPLTIRQRGFKEANAPSFVVKKDIIATNDRQMPLKWKSFADKSFRFKWSSRYGTHTGHSPRWYLIILYKSIFDISMPRKIFSWGGGGADGAWAPFTVKSYSPYRATYIHVQYIVHGSIVSPNGENLFRFLSSLPLLPLATTTVFGSYLSSLRVWIYLKSRE